jgi:competence protein ComEC
MRFSAVLSAFLLASGLPARGGEPAAPGAVTLVAPGDYAPDGPELVAVFLDIGQGDGAYVQTPDGRNILVDSGGTPSWSKFSYEPGREKVVPFLKSRGVSRLDMAVISHPHGDHIAGFLEVFRIFPVAALADPGLEHDEPEYPRLLKLAESRRSEYLVVGEGDALDWGPSVRVEVLNPPRDFAYQGLNDNSIVLRVTYKSARFLFTGDVEQEAENRLARRHKDELSADVLKVPHHGSRTSTIPRFLEAVSPRIVVVSCGRRNLFGHPHPSTVSRLSASGAELYRTDEDGDVEVRTDGTRMAVFLHGNRPGVKTAP